MRRYWWQNEAVGRYVAPFDYPPHRVAAARDRVERTPGALERIVRELVAESPTPQAAIRNISRFVQGALVHPPLLQPAEAPFGYWWWRTLAPTSWAYWPRLAELLRQRLVMDPDVLLELGEGRCGQCVSVLCAALRIAGFSARPWQLPHHVVAEVAFEGNACVIDADAFKNGIMLERNGRLLTRKEIESNPYLVDRLKPTGWMFRRDSMYARAPQTGLPYRGYLDFYSPEEDGQISARYGAEPVLKPPGLPRWNEGRKTVICVAGEVVEVSFASEYPERACGYRVRVGRESRGYSYDDLVKEHLGAETSAIVFELELGEPCAAFKLAEKGRYFVTAAAVPSYLADVPSYVWWSDELVVDVV